MPFTSYFSQRVMLNAIGRVPYTFPATYYVGVSTTAPSQVQAGSPLWGFTEPNGNSYSRIPVPNDNVHWGPLAAEPSLGYTIQNLVVLTYLQSSGPWATGANLDFYGVWDSALGGNLLWFGGCNPPQAVAAPNITLSFAAGAMTSTIN